MTSGIFVTIIVGTIIVTSGPIIIFVPWTGVCLSRTVRFIRSSIHGGKRCVSLFHHSHDTESDIRGLDLQVLFNGFNFLKRITSM